MARDVIASNFKKNYYSRNRYKDIILTNDAIDEVNSKMRITEYKYKHTVVLLSSSDGVFTFHNSHLSDPIYKTTEYCKYWKGNLYAIVIKQINHKILEELIAQFKCGLEDDMISQASRSDSQLKDKSEIFDQRGGFLYDEDDTAIC